MDLSEVDSTVTKSSRGKFSIMPRLTIVPDYQDAINHAGALWDLSAYKEVMNTAEVLMPTISFIDCVILLQPECGNDLALFLLSEVSELADLARSHTDSNCLAQWLPVTSSQRAELSTICSEDNTEPADQVIRKMNNYLMQLPMVKFAVDKLSKTHLTKVFQRSPLGGAKVLQNLKRNDRSATLIHYRNLFEVVDE